MLEVHNLNLYFSELQVLHNLSFEIKHSEILALVGESASGKSLTALSILGLEPSNSRVSGQIIFQGEEILGSKGHNPNLRKLRGKKIAYIPQDPFSSLNPVYSIGFQLKEALEIHAPELSLAERTRRCLESLESVDIADPERAFKAYPHELSGGMRQRVMIAMALLNGPDLLIADEPTTALDVTVQATILKLLKSLSKTILFITHDLGVVAEIADRVIVLDKGRIVESKTVFEIFEKSESKLFSFILNPS